MKNFKPVTTQLIIFAILISTIAIQSNQATGQQGELKVDSESVLLKVWVGPYGGVPPWRMVKAEEFLPSFDAAIKLSEAEIEKIANMTKTIIDLVKFIFRPQSIYFPHYIEIDAVGHSFASIGGWPLRDQILRPARISPAQRPSGFFHSRNPSNQY